MASIKVKFRRPSAGSGHTAEGTIYYQIIHQRKVRQLSTSYRIMNSEWNENRNTITITEASSHERYNLLKELRHKVRGDLERLHRIIRRLEEADLPYTSDDIVDDFREYCREYTLFNYIGSVSLKLKNKGKIRTSDTYIATLNSFKRFRGGVDIMLDDIDSDVIEAYEAYLIGRGVTYNTSSFYMRILRATYNRAVDTDVIMDRRPFRHVYTGVDHTVKRALPLEMIRELMEMDLSSRPNLDYARDMFILSFALRGMSFVDMAYLRKSDLSDGYLTYIRRKTGRRLTIKWTDEMQSILGKYPENSTPYLLPILNKADSCGDNAYRSKSASINRNLKTIAPTLGVTIPLTLYVARHSWASAARKIGVPISVISEGMGHENESTTRIYLASLDTSAIDNANTMILRSIGEAGMGNRRQSRNG
ncbi:MAG: site-specific integrase [Paenibacillus sp.]|nr:site-specific integrase [Paenibacillus sp.]